jgi:hypothetical protein
LVHALVGTVDSSRRAVVDGVGRVLTESGWMLDWRIGAEDRWHRPAEEASTRQSRVSSAPVIETRVRIPGGDAVGRAYGIQGPSAEGGHEYVIVEVANESPVPVAVAFTIEPVAGIDDGTSRTVALDESGRVVLVNGEAAVIFAAPARAEPEYGFLLPVPHRTSVRVALPLIPTSTYPSVIPSPEQVAAGWEAQVRRGMQLDLPDPVLQERFEVGRRELLLRVAGDHLFDPFGEHDVRSATAAAVALDEYGFHPEAGHLLAGMVERAEDDRETTCLLTHALDRHEALAHDRALVRATRRYRRRASRRLRRASSPSVPVHQDVMSGLRALVVDDHPGSDGVPGEVVLLRGWEATWAGQPVEAHRVPTRFGVFSFGLRWHGDRPALLWEVASTAGVDPPRIRLPALDPRWVGEEQTGEALLAPVTPSAEPVDT